MTLTLKTAKHAIDKHGEVFKIVDHYDDPTELATGIVTRNEAEDIGDYDPTFKPCIAVTNAHEALDAAWELAHEPEDGVIPRAARYISRSREDGKLSLHRLAHPMSTKDPFAERRLLDAPETEPEPWELSQFCYATGMFFERCEEGDGPYWVGGDCCPQRYEREDMAKLNPKPITIEGDEQ